MSEVASPGADGSVHAHEAVELRKEAYTMALYVAICLLAALAAVSEHTSSEQVDTFKIVWGTTVGLAIAHWLAFRVSARLVAAGEIRRHDAAAAAAQLAGAAAVAVLATVPILLLPTSVELDVTRLVLSGFVALVGYAVARAGGAPAGRALVYGAAILVLTISVAVVKNVLSGH